MKLSRFSHEPAVASLGSTPWLAFLVALTFQLASQASPPPPNPAPATPSLRLEYSDSQSLRLRLQKGVGSDQQWWLQESNDLVRWQDVGVIPPPLSDPGTLMEFPIPSASTARLRYFRIVTHTGTSFPPVTSPDRGAIAAPELVAGKPNKKTSTSAPDLKVNGVDDPAQILFTPITAQDPERRDGWTQIDVTKKGTDPDSARYTKEDDVIEIELYLKECATMMYKKVSISVTFPSATPMEDIVEQLKGKLEALSGPYCFECRRDRNGVTIWPTGHAAGSPSTTSTTIPVGQSPKEETQTARGNTQGGRTNVRVSSHPLLINPGQSVGFGTQIIRIVVECGAQGVVDNDWCLLFDLCDHTGKPVNTQSVEIKIPDGTGAAQAGARIAEAVNQHTHGAANATSRVPATNPKGQRKARVIHIDGGYRVKNVRTLEKQHKFKPPIPSDDHLKVFGISPPEGKLNDVKKGNKG